jgi:hypothetical protein
METTTQPQPKWVRFDSSALSPDDAIATPMAAARTSLQTHCALLQPENATLLLTLGKEHLLLMQKTLHRTTQVKKLTDDDSLIPRSARIKFTLSMSKLAESDLGYQSLKEETKTLVAGFQKALKTKIIKVAELEVKLLQLQIQTNLATNLFVATKAILICNTLTPDPHQIVNTIFAWYDAPLLASFDLTVDNFRKLYCTTHSITTLLPPIAGSIAAPLGHDVAPIPSPVFQTFIQIYRVIDNIFLCSWTAYVGTQKCLAITAALRALRVEHFEPAATYNAAMLIHREPAAELPQLRAIVDAQVLSKTASLQKEVSSLCAMISALKTQKRGPSPGASVKKKTAAGAAAPGKTSTKGAAEKPSKRSRHRLGDPIVSCPQKSPSATHPKPVCQ